MHEWFQGTEMLHRKANLGAVCSGLVCPNPCRARGIWVMLSRWGIIANTWASAQTPHKNPAWSQSLTQLSIH